MASTSDLMSLMRLNRYTEDPESLGLPNNAIAARYGNEPGGHVAVCLDDMPMAVAERRFHSVCQRKWNRARGRHHTVLAGMQQR